MLNKHQKLNTGLQWRQEKKQRGKKQQIHEQWRAGSLKHSFDLQHTFASNNAERQQMYGQQENMRKKTARKDQGAFVRTLTGLW